MATFEADSFGYTSVVSVVHFETGRIGGLHEARLCRGAPEDASRTGNEKLTQPSEDATVETTDTPFLKHTYTGGDEVFCICREKRFKRQVCTRIEKPKVDKNYIVEDCSQSHRTICTEKSSNSKGCQTTGRDETSEGDAVFNVIATLRCGLVGGTKVV